MYFESLLKGTLCLNSIDGDKFYITFFNTLQIDSGNNTASISILIDFEFDFIQSLENYIFCDTLYIASLMPQSYKILTFDMSLYLNEYFDSTYSQYDVFFVNVSDSQTIVCIVISFCLMSIFVSFGLKYTIKFNELPPTMDKKDWDKIANSYISCLLYFSFFVVYALVTFFYKIDVGQGCILGAASGLSWQMMTEFGQMVVIINIFVIDQFYILRCLLFKYKMHDNWAIWIILGNCKYCKHKKMGKLLKLKCDHCNCQCHDNNEKKFHEWIKKYDDWRHNFLFRPAIYCGVFWHGHQFAQYLYENRSENRILPNIMSNGIYFVIFSTIDWRMRSQKNCIYFICHSLAWVTVFFIGFVVYVFFKDSSISTEVTIIINSAAYLAALLILLWFVRAFVLLLGCLSPVCLCTKYFFIAWYVFATSYYLDYAVYNSYDAQYAPLIIIGIFICVLILFGFPKSKNKTWATALSIFLQLLDITTDYNLMYQWLFVSNDYFWFAVQAAIILGSQIMSSWKIGNADGDKIKSNQMISVFTEVNYNVAVTNITNCDRFLTFIGLGRAWMGAKLIANYDMFEQEYSNLKIYEICFESIPTMVFQLYIGLSYVDTNGLSLTLGASIGITFIHVSFTIWKIIRKYSAHSKKHSHTVNPSQTKPPAKPTTKPTLDPAKGVQADVDAIQDIKIYGDIDDCDNAHVIDELSMVIDDTKDTKYAFNKFSHVVLYAFLWCDLYIRCFPFIFIFVLIRLLYQQLLTIESDSRSFSNTIYFDFAVVLVIFIFMIVTTGTLEYKMLKWMKKSEYIHQYEAKKSLRMQETYISYYSCFLNVLFVLPLKQLDQKNIFRRYV